MRLDRTEARILGALIEKQFTTPDVYPLTLKALISACNQKSNRDPVMQLREFEVDGCLLGLRGRGLVRTIERVGGRTARFAGLLPEELGVSNAEAAILAELLLRGPQSSGELHRRCARMAETGSADEVGQTLGDLAGRGFVRLLPRASGQRHARWAQLLCQDADDGGDAGGGEADPTGAVGTTTATPPLRAEVEPTRVPAPAAAGTDVAARLAEVEAELGALRRRVAELEAKCE